jgi:ABC-type branched-subunit amino acid transport system ATPase component
LALARALVVEPVALILDEPTAGLAPRVAAGVFDRVRALARDGVAVLMIEQNARAALGASDRAYVLADGENRLAGRAAALLDDPAIRDLYLGGGGRGRAG